MTKTLVVVESPAKAKTIEKYLGDDYAVRASYGHIRDLPRSKLGVDPDQDFAVAVRGPRGLEAPRRRPEEGAEAERGPGPRDRLRPRGRGDRLPRGDPAGRGPRRREARDLHRDHPRRHPGRLRAPPDDRHGAVRRPGGPPDPRPLGRLQDLAAPVEAGPARPVRRAASSRSPSGSSWSASARSRRSFRSSTGASTSGSPRRTPSSRSSHGSPRSPKASWPPVPTRRACSSATEGDAAQHAERLRDGVLPRHRRREEGAEALPGAAVHHLDAPAGGRAQARLQRPQDDDARPAALRGDRPAGRGNVRPHHVHANGLRDDRGLGAARDRGARAAGLREGLLAGRGPPVQDPLAQRAGGPRGGPSDERVPDAAAGRRSARARPAPALHADLAADRRDADGGRAVRPGRDRHRGPRARRRRGQRADALRPPRDRADPHVRRVPEALPRRARRRAGRGRRGRAAGAHGRAAPPHARGPAGAALHPAAPALHGGVAREEARGARDRPAVHLRVDHLDDPGSRVRAAGGSSGSVPKTLATS